MFACKNAFLEFLVLAAVVAAAPFRSQEALAQTPASKPTDRITGVVINSVTHEPIARALVVSEGEQYATMTDSSGRFEFVFADAPAEQMTSRPARPASGNINAVYRPYELTARKPGFMSDQNEARQSRQRVAYGKDIEIALVPEALVIGHVSLPTLEPPDPIEVELFRREVRDGRGHWVSVKVESTNSEGNFRFAELPGSTYKLLTHELRDDDPKFSAPGGPVYGYAPVYYPNTSGFASAGTIELTPGKTVEANISLARQPYFPVFVPVTNVPPDKPFGLEVSVQGPGGPGYELQYDYQKQAITGFLPNGSYHLRAAGLGEQMWCGEANITVHGGAERAVLPLAAASAVRVDIKHQFTADVPPDTTTTVDSNGREITRQGGFDVSVVMQSADDFTPPDQDTPGVTRSGAQPDLLHIEHVTPGPYWVEAYSTNGYVASVTAGGVDLLHHPLVVPSGSSAPSIEVVVRNDTASVEGVVEGVSHLTGPPTPISLGPYGSGLSSSDSSARLYFIPLPDSAGRFSEQNVSHDGKFSVSLAPGEYRVLVFPQVQPNLEYENPEAMRAYDSKGQVVRLTGGQKEKLHLQLVSPSE